ncbi:MAG: substrate-binding domain-containing protein [Alloprevotella sp.]
MRRFLPLLMLLALACVQTGCQEKKKYKICVSQCSQDDWRAKMNDEINREILLHDDATVEICSADDSSEKQIADIRRFMKGKCDILIVSPNEAAALTPVIKEVYEQGTPVIVFDRSIIGDTYTARIGVDDEGIGRAAARYAQHLIGKHGKVIEIYGLPGSTPAENRHDGFAAELQAQVGTILASAAADWKKEEAVRVADSLLAAHPDAQLIYAHNDRMAIGASEAARTKGRRDIRIIGIDAAPNIGIRAVADSVIDATFLYPTEGHRLVQTALAILKGQPYQRETILPVSSAVDLTNADILLLQNETLKAETRKIKLLKKEIDDYWAQHSAQTTLFYACLAIIVLLFGVGFLLLRAYWQHSRHQRELMAKNTQLEQERDKQARLNAQLEQATQSKLVFFTNVSHDLRTPLTLIAEPVAQLASAPGLTPRQQTLARLAHKNVKIISRLINQILDFRKYENGKMTLNLAETNFSQAIADWVEAFSDSALRRDIRLTLRRGVLQDARPDAPLTLSIDAEKIERVVFNLIANALKHTPDNGSISVTYAASGDTLTLQVADTGEGIDPREIGNIFDRFYQADRTHPRGSGIGLALSKAFVEMHGGTIGVESTPGKGTVFTVTLPIRHSRGVLQNDRPDAPQGMPAAPVLSEAPSSSAADTAAELDSVDSPAAAPFDEEKPIALVIDDNKDMQTLVGEILRDHYNVITAANGKEGCKMALRHVPDLIICDVMMPLMDGLECCRRIKGEPVTSHIPVLMLTACTLDEQRVQGYDSGADGYLSKPFGSDVLLARCRSLIENRRRIDLSRGVLQNARTDTPAHRMAQLPQSFPSADLDSEFYRRFLEIFQAEMSRPELSVDGIAAQIGMDRSQFYRKIKALTNYAPVELIRRLRLQQGRALLLSTEKTIGEIAYETGFSSPAYFTKCYRDAYGHTPTQARAKIEEAQ